MQQKNINKTIIIGAGLGGLFHGILLKQARPKEDVTIYDLNKIPGGFCTAFEKAATHNGEKIKYTINIPLVTSDFNKDEPFDLLLRYMGVENIPWKVIDKPFQYYPENDKPFLFTKNGAKDLEERAANPKEKKRVHKFFKDMKNFYNDIFHKSYVNPTALQSLELLFKIPTSIFKLINDKTYLKYLEDYGLKSDVIKDVLCCPEAFMGVDIDKVSSVGELLMIQSFLENDALQPTDGSTFQTLSDRLAARFEELGGKLILKTPVESIIFEGKKAAGVRVNGEEDRADAVVISTAQDRIKELLKEGQHIRKIKKLTKKIDKLPYPNSDYYCYYLVDKEFVENNPKFKDITYHVYKLPEGRDPSNWKLAMSIPDQMYNDKYYVMWLVMFEQDQEKIDWWMDLRKADPKKYKEEKEKMAADFLEQLQEVEPAFKEHPPIKHLLTFSPASYLPYGSKYPISGLAQTPDNFGATRISPALLDNLFISGGASFSAGVWGAIAGGWQGFVTHYEKVYGVQIGNHDVLYKPGMPNLP